MTIEGDDDVGESHSIFGCIQSHDPQSPMGHHCLSNNLPHLIRELSAVSTPDDAGEPVVVVE